MSESAQRFLVVHAPEAQPLTCEALRRLLWDARHDTEWEVRELDADPGVLKAALARLESAADRYAADQYHAEDPRCGLTQPVTVAEGRELLAALEQARKVLGEG